MQIKQPCVACGFWERPGEPAYFLGGYVKGEWICDSCVEAGQEHIHKEFIKAAEAYHWRAERYESLAKTELDIPTREARERAEAEVQAYYSRLQAEAPQVQTHYDEQTPDRQYVDPEEPWF